MTRFKPRLGSGDNGYTYCIITRQAVPKTHSCIEFVGALDEAESSLGLAQSLLETTMPHLSEEASILEYMQQLLFRIGFALAGHECISDDDVKNIETLINRYAEHIEPVFILNGGHPAAAATSLARAVIRRAERAYWRCVREAGIQIKKGSNVARLLNRLSDLAFLLQLYINRVTGRETRRISCKD